MVNRKDIELISKPFVKITSISEVIRINRVHHFDSQCTYIVSISIWYLFFPSYWYRFEIELISVDVLDLGMRIGSNIIYRLSNIIKFNITLNLYLLKNERLWDRYKLECNKSLIIYNIYHTIDINICCCLWKKSQKVEKNSLKYA